MSGSTGSISPRLHAEVTDFGFGPAHALVALVEAAPDLLPLTVWSSGNALALLRAAVPGAAFEEMTPDPSAWDRFFSEVPAGSAVLTMSIPFGEAAHRRGMWVAVIDQLHWMWEGLTNPDVDCYLTPDYFGVPHVPPSGRRVAPLVTDHFRQPRATAVRRTAVVGFGGMSVMGDRRAADCHARWLLARLVPVVAASRDVDVIHVVGGSPDLARLLPESPRDGVAVRSHSVLRPEAYARLLSQSSLQFLSPGLATCYETEALGLSPFFLPATTKSGLMQAEHLRRARYPHVGTWSWDDDIGPRLSGMSQPDALKVVSDAVQKSVRDGDTAWLNQARQYVVGPRAPLTLPKIDSPPAAHVLLEQLGGRGTPPA